MSVPIILVDSSIVEDVYGYFSIADSTIFQK